MADRGDRDWEPTVEEIEALSSPSPNGLAHIHISDLGHLWQRKLLKKAWPDVVLSRECDKDGLLTEAAKGAITRLERMYKDVMNA